MLCLGAHARLASFTLSLFAGTLALAQFETRGTFTAESGSSPLGIAVGDFNHDGNLDLAVVSYCCPGGGVSILLGRGDGTFAPSVYYAAGDQPYSIVAADFDGDGNVDLAVANSLSNYVSILLNNGDGTFRAGPQNPTVPDPTFSIITGDFNGDGHVDLATVGSNVISVLLGNGNGTFQDAVVTEPSFAVQAIAAGDFNGDHKEDLATSGTFGGSSSVNILLGNGKGTFRNSASYYYPDPPGLIISADLRSDSKLDLVLANVFGGIGVMLGRGNGTFEAPTQYDDASSGANVMATKVNGGGDVGLIVADFDFPSGVSIMPGNGNGTFQSATFYAGTHETSWVAVADFNGDGKPDIVLANYLNASVTVLLNTGVVSFSPTTPLNFQKQAVGTTSPPQTVTLTNTGKNELKIASIKASAGFGVTSTCGSGVSAGAGCTISATFSPTRQGSAQGTITIIDSASTKPMVIELLGTGT